MDGTRRAFGRMEDGTEVELLSLGNGTLSCEIVTYGASLRALRVPDRTGRPVDVVLGYDTLGEYTSQGGHLGACVGRYANRIAAGTFTLDGVAYQLALNNGKNHLHGGPTGYSKRVWTVDGTGPDHAVLSIDSPDGDEGYPGHVRVRVTYRLDGAALVLRYEASVEGKATVLNLTNHTYFDLAGSGSGTVGEQEIRLCASRYTPSRPDGIPTGEIVPVDGTPMDLREGVRIGDRWDSAFEQIRQFGGYDHDFVLDGEGMRPAARARSGRTGIAMEAWTDQPGIQFYTANGLSARPGKDGAAYGPHAGFCLETQHLPDSPNEPTFPSTVLRPGETFVTTTRFVFSTED